MPALPVIPDVFRVALLWVGPPPSNAVNVMHFRKNSALASQLNTALQANFTAGMWGAVSLFAAITEASILPLDGSSAGQDFPWAFDAKWTGSMNTESVVAPAVVIKHQTGLRGRDKRGRTFLGILGEGSIVTGMLQTSLVTSMQTAWDTFRNAMLSAGWAPVVASYKNSIATDVTKYSIELALGTQRRRQGRIRRGLGF